MLTKLILSILTLIFQQMKHIIVLGTSDIFEMTEASLDPNIFNIRGYLAPQKKLHGAYKHYTYLGDDNLLGSDAFIDHLYVVAIYDNKRREIICNILESKNSLLLNI